MYPLSLMFPVKMFFSVDEAIEMSCEVGKRRQKVFDPICALTHFGRPPCVMWMIKRAFGKGSSYRQRVRGSIVPAVVVPHWCKRGWGRINPANTLQLIQKSLSVPLVDIEYMVVLGLCQH
jgi:hypothetical protein